MNEKTTSGGEAERNSDARNLLLELPFRRFETISSEDVSWDCHMHTTWSDGAGSVREMINAAVRAVLSGIVITDHVRADTAWFPDFKREVSQHREQAPIPVLAGFEAKAADFQGAIDASPAVIDGAEVVVGSVHRYPDGDGGLIPMDQLKAIGAARALHTERGLLLGMLRNPALDVLGHPFGVFSSRFGAVPDEALEEVIRAAAETEVAFEVSTKYYLGDRLFPLLKKWNPRVSFGSDAHRPDVVGLQFTRVRKEIARCR